MGGPLITWSSWTRRRSAQGSAPPGARSRVRSLPRA